MTGIIPTGQVTIKSALYRKSGSKLRVAQNYLQHALFTEKRKSEKLSCEYVYRTPLDSNLELLDKIILLPQESKKLQKDRKKSTPRGRQQPLTVFYYSWPRPKPRPSRTTRPRLNPLVKYRLVPINPLSEIHLIIVNSFSDKKARKVQATPNLQLHRLARSHQRNKGLATGTEIEYIWIIFYFFLHYLIYN